MRLVERDEILRIGEYEAVRAQFRARVIAEKKERRIKIGDRVSGVFETHDSVLLQVQEMLRTERITREEAILHEIATYNELVPKKDELSLTAMIEIDDKEERERFLVQAKGIEAAFYVEVGGERVHGSIAPERLLEDRASAVLYLKFALPPGLAEGVRSGKAEVAVGVEHAAYSARTALGPEVARALGADLREPS
ncbi:MAG: DUF3501 family protein [Polyangiaceae bacterium]